MKIGQGFDAHEFQAGDELVLGGVTIPFEKGLRAHSDGDLVLHALCDALFGAAGMGDLGVHFPDTEAEFKDISSRVLLRRTFEMIQGKKLSIGNVDITIVAQAPRMANYIKDMRINIAEDLSTSADIINIKATTTEGMGFTGRGEGIAAFAVVLLN